MSPIERFKVFLFSTKWEVTGTQWMLIASTFNLILFNWPLVLYAFNNLDGTSISGLFKLLTLVIIVFTLSNFFLGILLIIGGKLTKAVFLAFLLINSVAIYFIVKYQVLLDRTMMGNIFNTQFSESIAYFSYHLILYFIIYGLVPAYIFNKISIKETPKTHLFTTLILAFLFCLAWVYLASSTWLWFDKNAKQLGGRILPWSYVFNIPRYQIAEFQKNRNPTLLPKGYFLSDNKTIVILVIGESARSQNFSLYGYNRPTNINLDSKDVLVIKDVKSCSTYTTESVRCILSHNKEGISFMKQYESLPSYLYRHGIDSLWRTNNWGEPPLSIHSYEKSNLLRENCVGSGCDFDEVLLHGLKERIAASDRNKIFITLHQSGSHGPLYSKKYPPEFEVFTPACNSTELNQCSPQSLVNAYDNTIVYTDYFLGRAIDILKSFPDTPAVLIYVSDHGESLGEHGLYLHGTPFSIAPDEQISIPFIVWMSPEFAKKKGLSVSSFNTEENISQSNVFHSVMGAFDLTSDIYNKELDIFSKK